MGESPTQKNHEPSPFRQNEFGFHAVVIQIKAQLATLFRLPAFVQIEHAGQFAAVVITKLVDMPGVEGARRIAGKMAFELEQAKLQRAIQRQPQLFETILADTLRFTGRRLLHPQDFIATNFGSNLPPFAAAHRRFLEIALCAGHLAVAAQRCCQLKTEKIIDHHPAVHREAVGDPFEIFELAECGQCAAPPRRARP